MWLGRLCVQSNDVIKVPKLSNHFSLPKLLLEFIYDEKYSVNSADMYRTIKRQDLLLHAADDTLIGSRSRTSLILSLFSLFFSRFSIVWPPSCCFFFPKSPFCGLSGEHYLTISKLSMILAQNAIIPKLSKSGKWHINFPKLSQFFSKTVQPGTTCST